MTKTPTTKTISLLTMYTMIFFMLREWLVPVVELTDTGHLKLFLLFVGICLVAKIVHLNGWVAASIKLAFVLWFLMYVYTGTKVFSVESITTLGSDIQISWQALIHREWDGVTNSFRSILFFILLWMTVYLIHYWVTVKHTIIHFLIVTVIFLALLDTLSDYNAKFAIIRIMILGLLLLGTLYVNNLFESNDVERKGAKYIAVLIPLGVMLVASTVFAYAMPKKGPMATLPQSISTLIDQQGKNDSTIGKIGYVEDDKQLGGPFKEDSRIVFNATAESKQYWRVETKDIYTSKGWERKKGDVYVEIFDYGENIPLSIKPGSNVNQTSAGIKMHKDFKFIMQPYGLKAVEGKKTGISFYREIDGEKIRPLKDKKEIALDAYAVSYSSPKYSLKTLENTHTNDLKKLSKDYEAYLQLPKKLPKRVKKLAISITEDEKSLYDKANAIVSYFRNNKYVYNREDVAIPGKDDDYVDQFLFDTKVGYCDNFSSSMVVLLRSVGIPARWVKGFSEGEEIKDADGDKKEFVITNNNAHSWVEAYMPGVGWMSFEPTIGFDGFDNVLDDVDEKQEPTPINPKKEKENAKQKEAKKKEKEQPKEEKAKQEEEKKQSKKKQDEKSAPNMLSTKIVAAIVGALVVIACLLFLLRRKWIPKAIIAFYRMKKPEQISLDHAYHLLLKQLEHVGLKKGNGQTLQDFARYVDERYSTTHMSKITTSYEQQIYSNEKSKINWLELKESWEYLINSTSG
ncbi:transglutaminase domain-containing protein [Viridibacillus sp. YIM B01967]|uniref:Transglutaminase domain-containing protein n=1 Tax=Viridibacillus soli TaxID=2798301 RepID=A0ABS1HB55_9BACL|nr:transglutaminase domain-containing protein [Viridibacillus soli]MBK3496218.1 transglutaminase domain-containing protein [Viridibacillus soli]